MIGGGHDYFSGNNLKATNSYHYPLSEDVPHHWLLGDEWDQLTDFTEVKPYLTDALTDKAVDFITAAASADEPWFLYLPYNAPHSPLQAPANLIQKYTSKGHDWHRARYLAMIDSLDQNVGRIMDTISDAGRDRRDACVLLVRQRRRERRCWELGRQRDVQRRQGLVLRGWRPRPFVASWPGRWPAGATYDKPVISLDIAATAMAMAGVTAQAALPLDGVNLDGYVRSTKTGEPHQALFWHWDDRYNNGLGARYAVVSGDLKLVKNAIPSEVGLYNLSTDPGETTDLFDETSTEPSQHRTDAERLRSLWNSWNSTNVGTRYEDILTYKALPPYQRASRTLAKLCETEGVTPIQIGSDFMPTTSVSTTSVPNPPRFASQTAPALRVIASGGAAWTYTLPQNLSFVQAELRWREHGTEDINDWTGKSSTVFTSKCAFWHQIPSLKTDVPYKAQLIVSARDANGNNRELKSNTVVFRRPLPSPTLTATNAGVATWSYTLPSDLTFVYNEVRWRQHGTEYINDWSGRSNKIFYGSGVNSWQIPGLTTGVKYKAKLFVGVRDSSGTNRYLKSSTVVFTAAS